MRSLLRPIPSALAAVLVAALLTALPAARPAAAAAPVAGPFVAVAPARVIDSRSGLGGVPKGAVGANATITGQVGGRAGVPASGVSAVAVTISTVTPAQAGVVIAFAAGSARPATTNVQFAKGQQVSTLAVVPVSPSGAISLYNQSAGAVQLVVDLSGYFVAGSASPAATGSFSPVAPMRVVDTRNGAGGNRTGVLSANAMFPAGIGGQAGVPSSGVSAVVVTISAITPTQTGGLTAWADGTARPGVVNVQFAAGRSAANLAVVPVSADGRIDLFNRSSGTVHVVVDVTGYFVGGVPTTAGTLGSLTPSQVLDTRVGTDGNRKGAIPANATIGVQIGGNGGVPKSGVSAVALTVISVTPAATGAITAWGTGPSPSPAVTNLQFRTGDVVSNLVIVPVSATGAISITNRSPGALHLVAAVSGYFLKADLHAPPTSPSHYVRNITGAGTDAGTMHDEGVADAAAGAKFVLLDIGAQLNNKNGVQLSGSDGAILTYAQLVTALNGYLAGFGPASGVTVAVATNNDADDWTNYPAAARGQDWATKVIGQLKPGSGVTAVGADDIEGGFFSTEAQAQAWETAYLGAASTKKLIFAGSADGCPTTFGATGQTCAFGWTQAQFYALAGGTNKTHQIQALPQIYLPEQAVQWADIDVTGGGAITFAGAVTEHAACPTAGSPGCGFAALPANQGWAALYLALATLTAAPAIPAVTDLRIDS